MRRFAAGRFASSRYAQREIARSELSSHDQPPALIGGEIVGFWERLFFALSNLQVIPFEEIKIDQAFIRIWNTSRSLPPSIAP
jgi:hypothetical protein